VRTAAVIPVKTAAQCKQRLSTLLDAATRRKLVEVMLDRVVNAARGVGAISEVYIVTNDAALVPEGVHRIADPGTGLNGAIQSAATQLSGQVDAMLVLPADIPLITPADVARLVESGASRQMARSHMATRHMATRHMVIVTDVLRSGTNALLLAPPTLVTPRFGAASLMAHLRAALEADVRAVVHDCPNIARDIDEPRDVAWLLEHSHDSGFEFLRSPPEALAG
jgi:2-phospho-L-lactate/phosphoenolpyruvate guanylyltransferase